MDTLKIGDRVHHAYFGYGEIKKIYGLFATKYKNGKGIAPEMYCEIVYDNRPNKTYAHPLGTFQVIA